MARAPAAELGRRADERPEGDGAPSFVRDHNRFLRDGAAEVRLTEDGTADKSEPFAEGWLDQNGEYLGRPVDVAQLRDGSLLVSDDLSGALYRIWYDGK